MSNLSEQKFVFGNIFLLANQLQVLGNKYLDDRDMTTKQWLLTAIIASFGENSPTLSEVAELMGSSRQNIKQLAVKLAQKEFLVIDKDKNDARALRLKLTEKCNEFWKNTEGEDIIFLEKLFHGIGSDEIRATTSCIKQLLTTAQKLDQEK